MCGICGKLVFDNQGRVLPSLLKEMADTIYHRGPDDEGYYSSGPVGLGFRRLSIIDLNTGHQPISNEDGTIWIVFNGEIYNFKDLRQELRARGHVFKTQTDTEVIVHLYEDFGQACVEKLRGMFAFAVWDERQRSLFLARDRVGIKPLYYWLSDKSVVFGSEIKAILADPEVRAEVRPEMVDRFLTFYYVPGEETLFRNIYKLAPGTSMLIRDGKTTIRPYWDLKFAPESQNLQNAEEELVALLDESVRQHMISDVPVGFLLSGGVDSTAMLGFAERKSDHPLSSFTLGFSDPGVVDERPYARLAAERYGSKHYEMTIGAKEFAEFLPRYAWHMEEPVCEPTAVALYYVSRLAKDHVKVLISGEGGDEAFAGYPNYRNFLWLERMKKVAGPATSILAELVRFMDQRLKWERAAKYSHLIDQPLDSYYYSRISSPGTFFNTNANSLYTLDFAAETDKTFSIEGVRKHLIDSAGYGVVNRMLYVDTKIALPDDLLLKADKMTMANSIELRVPLLDHRVLEFAARLPENFKVRRFTTKYIAKTALRKRVPQEILDRKKVGFPVPFSSWMRIELKDYVSDVLLDSKTVSRGYFKKKAVEDLINVQRATGRLSKEVLSLISLELWHRAFLTGENQIPSELPATAMSVLSRP